MKIRICPKKHENRDFWSKFSQNFRLRRAIFLIKFVIKFGDASRRQSSIWTKNSLDCVQKKHENHEFEEKNNHKNHENGESQP